MRYVAFALIAIGVIVGVYYLIPGIHHVILFTFSKPGTVAASAIRPLHAAAGFVVAVLGVVLFFLTRPKKATA
jgi:hypothetical protein